MDTKTATNWKMNFYLPQLERHVDFCTLLICLESETPETQPDVQPYPKDGVPLHKSGNYQMQVQTFVPSFPNEGLDFFKDGVHHEQTYKN